MQLILADTADTKGSERLVTFGNTIKTAYGVRVKVQEALIGSNDVENAANNILSELTTGMNPKQRFLHISLYPYFEKEDYKVMLNCLRDKKGFSLLKNLWDRFKDDVIISLELNSANIVDGQVNRSNFKLWVSAKGLLDLREDRNVSQTTLCYKSKLDLTGFSGNFSFHAKIIVHIPDELLHPNANLARETNRKILEDSVSSDVIIEAGGAGEEIRSHKCFLISSSSVLQRMFESGMEESQSGRIDMTDISVEGVKAFLQYIYHGVMIGPGDNLDLAFNLLYAAHKYDVPKLEASVKTYLMQRNDEDFSLNLALKIYSLVRGVESASELKAKMVQYMSLKYDELNELSEFKEVFQKNPNDALEICGNLVKVRPPPTPKRKLESGENNAEKRVRTEEAHES